MASCNSLVRLKLLLHLLEQVSCNQGLFLFNNFSYKFCSLFILALVKNLNDFKSRSHLAYRYDSRYFCTLRSGVGASLLFSVYMKLIFFL